MSNKNLNDSKKNKNDEFYTRLEDIEKELHHYWKHFENKVIFLNCDDPERSKFWFYFKEKFDELKLKKLIGTHYTNGLKENAYALIKTPNSEEKIFLKGNGDFRSEEAINFLKECDIVITNPPFSLFREFINQLMEYNKKFIIIGSVNAISYKNVFSLIRDNKIWLGINSPKKFRTLNNDVIRGMTSLWYTNLTHSKINHKITLIKKYKGNEEGYPEYDDYHAININKVVDIPNDYNGVMGVPISFIEKHNPDQFKIIDMVKPKIDNKLLFSRILIVKNPRKEVK